MNACMARIKMRLLRREHADVCCPSSDGIGKHFLLFGTDHGHWFVGQRHTSMVITHTWQWLLRQAFFTGIRINDNCTGMAMAVVDLSSPSLQAYASMAITQACTTMAIAVVAQAVLLYRHTYQPSYAMNGPVIST